MLALKSDVYFSTFIKSLRTDSTISLVLLTKSADVARLIVLSFLVNSIRLSMIRLSNWLRSLSVESRSRLVLTSSSSESKLFYSYWLLLSFKIVCSSEHCVLLFKMV